MTSGPSPEQYEIRLIDSRSPHFLLLESWGIWAPDQRHYLRVRGTSGRIRRFYARAAAEAYLDDSSTLPPSQDGISATVRPAPRRGGGNCGRRWPGRPCRA